MAFTGKYPWETDLQWQSRNAFIDAHKHKYDFQRLAPLSSAWLNWKFHGCRYSLPVQRLLEQLDSELPDELKAAVDRRQSRALLKRINFKKQTCQDTCQETRSNNVIVNGLTIFVPESTSSINSISILHESVQKSRKTIEFQDLGCTKEGNDTPLHSTALLIDGKLIATGKATNKKESKRNCADMALEILRKSQPIVVKTLNHENVTQVKKTELTEESYRNSQKIDDSNIGNKMLRKMGWTGDGGLSKGGIADPVFVDSVDGRKGFGHEVDSRQIQRRSVEDVLLKFVRDQTENEIKFSNDLSKADRELVHKLSQKYGLGHKSFGKGGDRYLLVTRNVNNFSFVPCIKKQTQGHGPIWS